MGRTATGVTNALALPQQVEYARENEETQEKDRTVVITHEYEVA